jgi:hypothetical protein
MFSTSCIQLRTFDFLSPVFNFTEQRENRRVQQTQAHSDNSRCRFCLPCWGRGLWFTGMLRCETVNCMLVIHTDLKGEPLREMDFTVPCEGAVN